MIRFRCPHCQKTITCKDTLAGRKANCPGCGGVLVVPSGGWKWYFVVNGKRFGPVAKAALVRLAAEKKLKPTDKVWSKPLGNRWVEARRIPGLFPSSQRTVPARSSSSSGKTLNRDLMRQARQALKGKWGTAIGLCLIYMVLIVVASVIPFIGWLTGFLVTAPLNLGLYSFFLKLSQKQEASINGLFSGFQQFGTAVGAYLMVALMVLLWTVAPLAVETVYFGSLFLKGTFPISPSVSSMSFPTWLFPVFLVHGVLASVASLVYSMTFFNVADSPSCRPVEAIKKSREMMKGNLWKLFCLECRFIGWIILGALSFGIGFLWIWPYMMTSFACFYEDLKK